MKKSKVFEKIKKILITVICIITVIFSMPVKSSADAGILENVASIVLLIPDGIQWLLNRFVSDETEDVKFYIRLNLIDEDATIFSNEDGSIYNMEVTPYDIFTSGTQTIYGKYVEAVDDVNTASENFKNETEAIKSGGGDLNSTVQAGKELQQANSKLEDWSAKNFITTSVVKMPLLDANFFKKSTKDNSNSADILRPVVSNIYNNLRDFVLILMLVILLYIGIRIIISSAVSEQVKYKQYLINWIVGICLVFLMQYIMSAIMMSTKAVNEMLITSDDGEIYKIGFGTQDSTAANRVRSGSTLVNTIGNGLNWFLDGIQIISGPVGWARSGVSYMTTGKVISLGDLAEIKARGVSMFFNYGADAINQVWGDGWDELASDSNKKINNFVGRKLEIADQGGLFEFDDENKTVQDYMADLNGTPTKLNAAVYSDDVKGFRAIYKCNIAEYCRTLTTFSTKYTHIYSNNKEAAMSDQDESEENDYSSAAFWGYAFLYVLITIETIVFLYKYLKRVLWLAFLTMIAPLIALMYPIDKVGDGKAQTFNMWFKEYLFNSLIQPLHILLYIIFINAGTQLMTTNVIYGIVAYAFMIPAEKFFKKMFGFDKASTPGGLGSPAAGMMAMRGLDRLGGFGPHGKGGKNSDKGNNITSKLPMAKKKFGTIAPNSNGVLAPNSSGISAPNSNGVGSILPSSSGNGGVGGLRRGGSLVPNSSGRIGRNAGILNGIGHSIGSRFANRITGGKTTNLGHAFKGEKLSMLKTGGRFVGRQIGRVGGLAVGSVIGAGVGAVSGAMASALTGEDKFADALQKGVLVGGASGFNRGGQMIDSINDGLENLYDEGRRYAATENPGEAAKIRRDDWVKEHQGELSSLSANEYESKIRFLDNYFQYADTDSIEDIDQLDRMYDFCVDSNGNIDENKIEVAYENEKAKKKFGDLDIDKNYASLLAYNKSTIKTGNVTLSDEEKNKVSADILKQNMRKRDKLINKYNEELEKIKSKGKTIGDDEYDRANNQLKYAKKRSVAVKDEQLNEALEEALKNKRATYAQEEAERKTEMQRGYFR